MLNGSKIEINDDQPLGKYLLPKSAYEVPKSNDQDISEESIPIYLKYQVAFWKFFIYSFCSIYGFFTLYDKEWLLTPTEYWNPLPNTDLGGPLQEYYYFIFTQYLYASFRMINEPKQKDLFQMIIHHIVTLFLIGFSFTLGYRRVGVAIMLLHDIADPFMEFAKISLYCGYETVNLFIIYYMIIN